MVAKFFQLHAVETHGHAHWYYVMTRIPALDKQQTHCYRQAEFECLHIQHYTSRYMCLVSRDIADFADRFRRQVCRQSVRKGQGSAFYKRYFYCTCNWQNLIVSTSTNWFAAHLCRISQQALSSSTSRGKADEGIITIINQYQHICRTVPLQLCGKCDRTATIHANTRCKLHA